MFSVILVQLILILKAADILYKLLSLNKLKTWFSLIIRYYQDYWLDDILADNCTEDLGLLG